MRFLLLLDENVRSTPALGLLLFTVKETNEYRHFPQTNRNRSVAVAVSRRRFRLLIKRLGIDIH